MTPEQFNELIATLQKLSPDPFTPLLTTVVGVVVGFLLSTLSASWARRAERKRAQSAAIQANRQLAIDQLGKSALLWVSAFQVSDYREHLRSDRAVAENFLTTGEPGDQVVFKAVGVYLSTLQRNLGAYQEIVTGVVNYDAFTVAEQDIYETRVERVRAKAQKWVDASGRPEALAAVLNAETASLTEMRRPNDD